MEQVTDIVLIKHEVLKATAKHAFAGDLQENYDKIPYEIIPGIKPNFRCCVYREREIVLMRFGLEGRRELTQKEVAQKMGISQSYISRLEKRIMLRLKKEFLRQTSCA